MLSKTRKALALLTAGERRRLSALLGLLTVNAAVETLGISLVIPAMLVLTRDAGGLADARIRQVSALLGGGQTRLITAGVLALTAFFLCKTAFAAWVVWRQSRFTFGVQARLSETLFTTYLRQPYTFHLQRNSAQLIRNLVTEVREFTITVAQPGMLLVTEGLVLFGIATLLIVVQPIGALVVVSVIGLAVWLVQRATGARVDRWGARRQEHEGLRIQHLQQGLGAVKDIKVLGREDEFIARHRMHNLGALLPARLHHTLLELPRLGLEFLAVSGLAILVLTMVAQGRDIGTIAPTLGLFAAAAFRLMPSLNRVVNAAHLLRYGTVVVDTLHDELRLAAPPALPAVDRAPFDAVIELSGISYSYTDAAAPALSGISLAIRRGEAAGFIGPSGSGKSTLVDVVLGLLVPSAGRVLVDGRDIAHALRAWQAQVGYVPQSIYLTDDTIRRNVAFGVADGDIDDAAVGRAIHAAQLDEFVASRPDGLEAMLGERGVRLSGGQRQRLGIARALYHDPAVLVLDEATSALDPVTEREVMQAVMALHGSKTILVVAHRLTTVEYCDRLFRLDSGCLVQEGSSAEMLNAPRRVEA